MAAYLRLHGVDFWGRVNSGELQIGVNQATDGRSIGWLELRGDNGGNDAGTWEWDRNEYGFVLMKMRSNKFGVQVAELHAHEWSKGTVPPPKLWFKLISHGWFIYTFPAINAQVHCDWRAVKIVGAEL